MGTEVAPEATEAFRSSTGERPPSGLGSFMAEVSALRYQPAYRGQRRAPTFQGDRKRSPSTFWPPSVPHTLWG